MIYQVILVVLVIIIVVLLLSRKGREIVKDGAQKIVGICAAALGRTTQKQKNKEKIMSLFAEPLDSTRGKRELSNSDIRETLGNLPAGRQVAERTVVRYMEELEKEGKVEQVGTTGRGVVYRLK